MLNDKKALKNTPPTKLEDREVRDRIKDLPSGWKYVKPGALYKRFSFKKYKTGLLFAYQVGLIAERENHHPEILVTYHFVDVALSTHSCKGISAHDFILACEIEGEFSSFR